MKLLNKKTGKQLTIEKVSCGVKVTQASPFGGVHTLYIDTTQEKIIEYHTTGRMIQEVFPGLSADEREFIMTGIPPEQWPS